MLVKHYGAILPEFPTPATFTFQEYKYQQVLRDRQILQEVYFGEKGNYEEDLEIIDYECKDNNDLFISVGLLPETQERADLAGSIIDEKSIERI
ncbi:MAG: hypothetical protein LBI53_05600 [Candidatus Peribacteria bacterium]|nr:hypothetical protein [Candidatus Peribacteria bacterium]